MASLKMTRSRMSIPALLLAALACSYFSWKVQTNLCRYLQAGISAHLDDTAPEPLQSASAEENSRLRVTLQNDTRIIQGQRKQRVKHQNELESLKKQHNQTIVSLMKQKGGDQPENTYPSTPRLVMGDNVKTKKTKSVKSKARATITKEEIPRNPRATLASDITSIYHYPETAQVVVNLRAGARCPRPFLVGRLSGKALIKLDWTHGWSQNDDGDEAATSMTGSYTANAGQYVVEIIALYCHDFSYGLEDALERSSHDNVTLVADTKKKRDLLQQKQQLDPNPNPLETHFDKHICVEDPAHHRVTRAAASITVEQRDQKFVEGTWSREGGNEGAAAALPLYTRYQPAQCWLDRKSRLNRTATCQAHDDGLDQYKEYTFRWSESLKGLAPKMLQQPTMTKVCYCGFSHSRSMTDAVKRLKLDSPRNEHLNLTFAWVKAMYPIDVISEKVISDIREYGCNKLVIGTYQWPASFDRKYPMQFGDYYQDMKTMLQGIKREFQGSMDVFVRSPHHDALMGSIVHCPPADWRNPTVMSAYGLIAQQACRDTNTPFLDTSFLTDPVWDASPDYNHLNFETANNEALYLTALALGGIIDPTTHSLIES